MVCHIVCVMKRESRSRAGAQPSVKTLRCSSRTLSFTGSSPRCGCNPRWLVQFQVCPTCELLDVEDFVLWGCIAVGGLRSQRQRALQQLAPQLGRRWLLQPWHLCSGRVITHESVLQCLCPS